VRTARAPSYQQGQMMNAAKITRESKSESGFRFSFPSAASAVKDITIFYASCRVIDDIVIRPN